VATQLADGRTSRPPTPDEVRRWRLAYRETAATAIVDILQAVEASTSAATKRRGRAA